MNANEQVKVLAAKVTKSYGRWVDMRQQDGSRQAMAFGWARSFAESIGETAPEAFDAHWLLTMRNRAQEILSTKVNTVTFDDVAEANGWISTDPAAVTRVAPGAVKPGMWNCCQNRPAMAVMFVSEETQAEVWYAACASCASSVPADQLAKLPAMCDDDKCGKCAHCLMLATVTEDPKGFDEAMAEAERDEMTGIDMVRELLTLPPVRTAKPVVWHLNDGAIKPPCGKGGRQTTDPDKVTCKCCPKTARFAEYATREAVKAARDVWSGAGLRVGMVVRHLGSGLMGRINELSDSIRVGYWGGQHSGAYARLVDFDSACQIVAMGDLVPVGTRLVGNLSWEGVVVAVWADEVCLQVADRPVTRMSASEFAAEISRGWLAIVPTVTCRVCHEVLSNTQDHKHFDRPLTWPGMAQPPTALLKRAAGDVWVKLSDIIEVGNRINFGYGSANNGEVVALTWHAATVKRADGTQYLWTLTEAVRELNRANVSVYMPDASGRPVGSWR